ncbi:YybH family protein [Balneola sp. MJW-20]|uniref:YybH family protein n=1 Tax=Gracilimonas aurantiaca TaxID=3234185 RepID=UPI003465CCB2
MIRIIILSLFMILAALFPDPVLQAQSDDKTQILKVRSESNEALRVYDNERSYTFLTEDVLITTGNGSLISGKQELRDYVNAAGATDGERMFWIRTPDEVVVNKSRGLAWETGTWKGYSEADDRRSVIGGKYSAQWVKEEGKWLIRSQLFVTLE